MSRRTTRTVGGQAPPERPHAGPVRASQHDGPPRTCIVHIGLNKTGSTTIQGWLAQNADLLAAQGIRYDPFEAPQPAMHHAIGFAALGTHFSGRLMPLSPALETLGIETLEDQGAHLDAFEALADASIAAPGCHTYVISSEFLPVWLRQPDWAALFHGWLERRFDSIRYVIYLRDQIDWVPSAYTQYVKTGGTRTLDDFIENRGLRNYLRICDRWRRGVDPAPLDIRLLEPDFLADGDLIADFASVIGADTAGLRPVEKLNEALPVEAVEHIRRINLEAEETGDRAWRNARLHDVLAKACGAKLTLSRDQAHDVARRHAESNERLRRRFFRRRKILFPKSHALLDDQGRESGGPEAATAHGAAVPGSSKTDELGGRRR